MFRTIVISNADNLIDSKDVIARIAILEGAIESLKENCETAETPEARETATEAVEAWKEDEAVELKNLLELAAQSEEYMPDWHHGDTLIRESYFIECQQELLEDLGVIPKDFPTYVVIDWEATARNLKQDYTEVDFDGVTYLVR